MRTPQSLLKEHAIVFTEVKRIQDELQPHLDHLKSIESMILYDISREFVVRYDYSTDCGTVAVLERKDQSQCPE